MKHCNILDLSDVYEVFTATLLDTPALFQSVRLALINGTTYVFLSDCKTALVSYDNLGYGKYMVHIYTKQKGLHGKELRDLAVKAGRWMLDNTDAKVFINFVPDDRLELKLFMRMVGSKKLGKLPGNNEIIYVSVPSEEIME